MHAWAQLSEQEILLFRSSPLPRGSHDKSPSQEKTKTGRSKGPARPRLKACRILVRSRGSAHSDFSWSQARLPNPTVNPPPHNVSHAHTNTCCRLGLINPVREEGGGDNRDHKTFGRDIDRGPIVSPAVNTWATSRISTVGSTTQYSGRDTQSGIGSLHHHGPQNMESPTVVLGLPISG